MGQQELYRRAVGIKHSKKPRTPAVSGLLNDMGYSRGFYATLERVPINWNQLVGKTTLYFRVLERLFSAQSGEKRSNP
jgi:hypothetical protein